MFTGAACPIMYGCCGTRLPTRGQVPSLEKLVAVIRSPRGEICACSTSSTRSARPFTKTNAETILGNMDSVIFLGGRESSTIKEISENWLGKATISLCRLRVAPVGSRKATTRTPSGWGRELMTPSELATMPGRQVHFAVAGPAPVLFVQIRFETAPKLQVHG